MKLIICRVQMHIELESRKLFTNGDLKEVKIICLIWIAFTIIIILVGIKLVFGPQIVIIDIGGFIFGSSVKDYHTYICKYEILTGFNCVIAKVDRQTTKFNQIFLL